MQLWFPPLLCSCRLCRKPNPIRLIHTPLRLLLLSQLVRCTHWPALIGILFKIYLQLKLTKKNRPGRLFESYREEKVCVCRGAFLCVDLCLTKHTHTRLLTDASVRTLTHTHRQAKTLKASLEERTCGFMSLWYLRGRGIPRKRSQGEYQRQRWLSWPWGTTASRSPSSLSPTSCALVSLQRQCVSVTWLRRILNRGGVALFSCKFVQVF